MTTKRFLFVLFVVAVYISNGQSLSKKQIDFSLGVGIKTTFYSPGLYPLAIANFAVDYGFSKNFSGGIFVSTFNTEKEYNGKLWVSASWRYWNETHWWRTFICGMRLAYHFNSAINQKKDFYMGIMPGNNFVKHSSYNTIDSNNPLVEPPDYRGGFVWAVFVGCRYRFNNQAGVFAEVGYGITYLNFGMNYKINLGKKS